MLKLMEILPLCFCLVEFCTISEEVLFQSETRQLIRIKRDQLSEKKVEGVMKRFALANTSKRRVVAINWLLMNDFLHAHLLIANAAHSGDGASLLLLRNESQTSGARVWCPFVARNH